MAVSLAETQVTNIAVLSVFGLLSLTAVICRLASQRLQHHEFRVADYAMVVAWIFALGGITADYVAVIDGGMGRHQQDLSPAELTTLLKAIYATQFCWALAVAAVKTSMCCFYMQLFPQRWFYVAARFVLVLSNAFALTVVLGTVLICHPVAYSYDPTISGTCGNRVGMWVAHGVINLLTDLMVVLLPSLVLWRTSLKRSKKIGLGIIFSLGLFVCIISGLRLKFLLDIDFNGDAAFSMVRGTMWSLLEPTAAITFGCIPTMKPLYILVTGKARRRHSSESSTSHDDIKQHEIKKQNMQPYPFNKGFYGFNVTDVSASAPSAKYDTLGSVDGDRAGESGGIETTRQVDISYT